MSRQDRLLVRQLAGSLASRIIRAAARSLTDPPGFCHSTFAMLDACRNFALELVEAHERRAADQVEDGRTRGATNHCRFGNR
jgi:3-dehydroquinate dehydratase